jgi:hypothetical protein
MYTCTILVHNAVTEECLHEMHIDLKALERAVR